MKHLTTLLLTLLVLGGCSPSQEELKIKATEIYEEVRAIPADLPCRNRTGYQDLKKFEERNNTNFYSEITESKLKEYEEKCEALLAEAEKDRQIRRELNTLGNWKTGRFVDEFGDRTDKGYLRQTIKGTFSNSATTDSPLRVDFFLSNGRSDEPWFRFFEYDRNNPLKGYSSLDFSCRVKKDNGEVFPIKLYLGRGSDSITISKREKNFKKLQSSILNMGSVKFVCNDDRFMTDEYKFTLDFSYFANAQRKLRESPLKIFSK